MLRNFALFVLVMSVGIVAAGTDSAQTALSFPHWNGHWEISDEASVLLGFEKPDQRDFAFPTAFHLSIHATLKTDADQHANDRMLFQGMNHTISTSGIWKVDPKELGSSSTRCLVTKSDGGTYLWLTDIPFVAIHGGKVSFVEGRDSGHDLLIIDFNTLPKHESGQVRGEETVVYKRKR
jgi:hypothetical protein